jgi:hypothetical protein
MSTAIDTERVALSNELSTLAERFAIEATLWKLSEAKSECERVARYLAQLARAALSNGDIEVINAYAEASRILIDNVVGTRRFFHVIGMHPSVRRP